MPPTSGSRRITDAEGKYLFSGLSEDTYLVVVDEADPQFPSGLALVSASPAQPNPESVTLGTLQDRLDVDFAYNYTSSIGDLVWYDNNGNGLYEPASGENGVAGAYVMLYEDTNGNGIFDGDIDVQIGGTATASDGSYLLDNLAPGTYFVQVYEQSVRPEGCPSCVPNLMPTTATKVKVELDPNEAYVDADFGYKQGSIIEGSVFWDVNHNTVFEPQYPGAPEQGLGGITVWIDADGNGVLDWTDADSDGVWDEGEGEQWTVTDSDGSYKFFVTSTGSYLISYDINDADIPPTLQGPLAPTTATAQYVSITVLGEERTGIDFGRDNVGQIGDLIFGDRGTTGTYDGPATDPGLPYVVVELYGDTDGNGLFDPSSDGYIGTTTTDANGAYLFPGLPDGTYFVKVLGESLPLAWSTTPTVDPTSPLDGVGKATVTGGGSVLTMDFGYPPQQPGSISGTVFNDGGAVVGDGELNVAIIDGYVDFNRNGVSGLTDTADDGFFLGYQIIDGKVDVDGGAITTADDIADGSFDGKNIIDGMVDFNASGTSTTADDGTLSADTALASVIINLYNASGVLVATTATDANGNYRFDGLPPGTYTVEEVTPTGFYNVLDRAGKASDETGNTDVEDDLIPVTVTAGQVSANNNFLDDSDSTAFLVGLSGQVRNDVDVDGDFTDADTGINGVVIRLFRDLNGDGVTPLLSVIDGQIDLNEDGVISAADTGTLFGLPIIGGSVDVNNDGSITTADDLASFNGVQVIDGRLDVVPGGGITTADDGAIGTEPLVASTTTAGNGNYSFSNLAFGDYVVVETDPANAISTADVSADGINDNQIGVALSYGGETGRDFLDSITGTVSGHLYKDTNGNGVQDGGEPNLTGVDVLVEDSSGRLVTVYTDSNGNWTASVPPGTTTASVVVSDPQFLAVFPDGYTQTEGTNPTTVIAVGGINTSMGNDGYFSPYTNTNPASIAGTVFNDADSNGSFSGGDVPVGGVVVDLYLDTNNDHLVPFYNVIEGLIDVNGSGTISSTDDGTILGYSIINGFVDIDGNGLITVGDDGFFNGISVIDGILDLDGDGNGAIPDTDDNGLVAGEPLVGQKATASDGTYLFSGLSAASYVIIEHDPDGATSVDDRAAVTEFPGANTDNLIGVVLSASENSIGNDFLDTGINLYAVSGTVWNDSDSTGGFSVGDIPIPFVTVAIYADINADGWLSNDELEAGPIASMETSPTGTYTFSGLSNGNYVVVETDPANTTSVTDKDGIAVNGPNQIQVAISGASVTAQDFLDTGIVFGAISGIVTKDTDNNGTGDAPLPGVTVTLYTDPDGDGNPADGVFYGSMLTDGSGNYAFINLVEGSYVVVETDLAGYQSVSDGDVTADNPAMPTDPPNANTNDNMLAINLAAGETDDGNNFVDEQYGAISGQVLKDTDNDNTGDAPFPGVTLTLLNSDGSQYDSDPNTPGIQPMTAVTDGSGNYTFGSLPPGDYQVSETQPAGFVSVSDKDGGDLDIIGDVTLITVTAGATNSGNTFVEEEYASILGQVRYDVDFDGDLNDSDSGIAGVTIILTTDPNGDGDPSDGVMVATTTDATATTQRYPAGNYVVTEIDTGRIHLFR